MKASAILTAEIIILIFVVPGVTNAASGSDMKFYAAGDPVYISGSAPGAESAGLAAWILGPNYWSSEYFNTESGGSYTYEIDGGLTGSLSSGQYFVVIQHPMYNGVFDVTPETGTPSSGQTSVVSTDGGSFIIDGKGRLQGSAAAYALMNLLDSQNIDDVYTVTTFCIEEPWIRADDFEAWPAGSVITLEGTTNIATGERLIYTFSPASGDIPSPKQSGGTTYTTEMAGQASVECGMPYNTWTVDLDTEEMDPGTYIFKIKAVSEGSAVQKYITLYEPVSTPKSPEETVVPKTTGSAETTAAAETVVFAEETPQASASPFPVTAALFVAGVIAAAGKIYLRR